MLSPNQQLATSVFIQN